MAFVQCFPSTKRLYFEGLEVCAVEREKELVKLTRAGDCHPCTALWCCLCVSMLLDCMTAVHAHTL